MFDANANPNADVTCEQGLSRLQHAGTIFPNYAH